MENITFNEWASQKLREYVATMRQANEAYRGALERGEGDWSNKFDEYRQAAILVGMFIEDEFVYMEARGERAKADEQPESK